MKRGQVWISAVLYIALGTVAITIVLSAGVPVINKIKDKNTIIQTRDIMLSLDNIIREVRDEGTGSRRVISPFTIKGGSMFIKDNENKIVWEMKTNVVFVEPCGKDRATCEREELIIKEGPVEMYETTTIVENEYIMQLELDFKDVAFLDLMSDIGKNAPLLGKYNLKIENKGVNSERQPATNLPDILITLT
ncbi:hypothetical protein J4449_00705 [Candidatus Woesearchaeota archaeon]|nr:hypothetical protein [Candidatus Woesearchaeota archaeon]